MVDSLWNTSFGIFGECWASPATEVQFLLTRFEGFGKSRGAKSLWQCSIYATVWSIWLKRNSHTFNDKFSDKHVCLFSVAFFWFCIEDLLSSYLLVNSIFLYQYNSSFIKGKKKKLFCLSTPSP